MHVALLSMTQWEPESEYETWTSAIADEYPELSKCEMVSGSAVVRGVALRIRDQDVLVHLERTVCDTCGHKANCCAVPDFGAGDSEYRDFMHSLPRLNCPSCNRPYDRRIVVWKAEPKQEGEPLS